MTAPHATYEPQQPRPGSGAGATLWDTAPKRQSTWPIVVLAIVTLLIAAPTALSSSGASSSNPLTIIEEIATSSYRMTGMIDESNATLAEIDGHVTNLAELTETMAGLGATTGQLTTGTGALQDELGTVAATTGQATSGLESVASSLGSLQSGVNAMEADVGASLGNTRLLSEDFNAIANEITAMRKGLRSTVKTIGVAAPLTKQFAENRTVVDIAGGDTEKFGAPNILADNRVMSVVLPLINVMQNGGTVVARKDSAKGSNILIDQILKRQVPDGTNIGAEIKPYDGKLGLPPSQWFVENKVGGY